MANTIGIIQSNYLPWMGYFDLIRDCDLFIFHDDIQYTKGDWRNRNKVKTPNEIRWITVPVHYKESNKTTIDRTPIKNDLNWQQDHLHWIKVSYEKAPYFERYWPALQKILSQNFEMISELNRALITWIMNELEISTPIKDSRDLVVTGAKTERVIALLKKVDAKAYISGPAGRNYLDNQLFKANNISLIYKTYDYAPYPQIHGEFAPGLSVLDGLFNCGPELINISKSRSPNEVVL